jgi:hypothetical protein
MKFKLVSTSLIIAGILSTSVSARVPGRGASTATVDGSGTSRDINEPTIGVAGTVVSDGAGTDCDPRDTKGYVSMNFLRNIVDPSVTSPNEMKVVKVADGSYQVKIAKHIKACVDLSYDVVKADNNYFVRVKNNFPFTEDNVPVNEGENFEDLTMDEKYYRCVEGKGLLKNGAFDRPKAEQSGNISYGLNFPPFGVDIGDGSKSVSVYYGSPKASAYGTAWAAENVSPKPSGWNCVVYENFGENPKRVHTSNKDKVYDRALRVCQTESAEQILEELSRLKDSAAGNFKDLEKILEQAFNKAQEKRVDDIYKRMTEIEEAAKPGEDGKLISESLAKEYANEYSALAKEISRIVIQPNAQKISDLLKVRDSSNKDEIDAKVKELGLEIQEYSTRPYKKFGFMRDVLKEYALTEEARDIEGLRLASHFYGRVYKGKADSKRGKPMDLKDATDNVKRLIKSYEDNRLNDWEASYATRNGNKAPIRATIRDIRTRSARMNADWQKFQRTESANTQKYCGANMLGQMRNPVRCRSWMASKDRRQRSALNRRARHLTYLRTRTDQYSTYMTNFETFRENQVQANDGFDPFNDYGGTDFQTDYDIYGNPNDYSSDMSWMYSMGNQSPGVPNMSMRSPAGQPQIFSPGFSTNQSGMFSQPNPFGGQVFR